MTSALRPACSSGTPPWTSGRASRPWARDARRDGGTRAALADRDERPVGGRPSAELAREAVGDVAAAGQRGLLALVSSRTSTSSTAPSARSASSSSSSTGSSVAVGRRDGSTSSPRARGSRPSGGRGRPAPPRRATSAHGRRGARDAGEHEAGLRREAEWPETGTFDGARDVAGGEDVERPDVEHGRVARLDSSRRAAAARRGTGPRLSSTMRSMFGGRGGRDGGRVGDELLDRRERQRWVEPPLEADRRRRLRAHALAAERARDVARDRPRRRRAARAAGAGCGRAPRRPRAASTARSGRAASPTNSESPVRRSQGSSARVRSVTAKQQCSGRWPGVWMTRRRDVADVDLVAVRERLERVARLPPASGRDGDAVLEREPPVAGDVVGVRVRLEDAHDPDVVPLRLLEVLLDRVRRVDDDRLARVLAPTRYEAQPRSSSTNWRNSTGRG